MNQKNRLCVFLWVLQHFTGSGAATVGGAPLVLGSARVFWNTQLIGKIFMDKAATSRIIEMAWEDRTPFEAIYSSYGVSEPELIKLMRKSLKPSSFKLWRARVSGRKTKHLKLRSPEVSRGYCPTQYKQR